MSLELFLMNKLSKERSILLNEMDNRSITDWHLAFHNNIYFELVGIRFGEPYNNYFLYDTQNYMTKIKIEDLSWRHVETI